ncbi:MAG: transposase [Muribaculaceae bacterium]|nr:transposase [Muribaculaceae bacterium]
MKKVSTLGNPNFRSVLKTFKNHAPTILNYFMRHSTNASAEAFNSKVKIFRSQMRGVRTKISPYSNLSSHSLEF